MFTLSLLIIDCIFSGSLPVLPYQYGRIIIGAFIGMGFMLSTLIYEGDRFPFFAITLIQLLLLYQEESPTKQAL